MKTCTRLLVLFIFVGLASSHAFRSYQDSGARLVEKHEESFQVKSQIEHYGTITISPEGVSEPGDMLLIYYYEPGTVYGIVHLLDPERTRGYTALSIQREGRLPVIYIYRPGWNKAQRLSGSEWRNRMAGTPWNYEDMLDDDKEDWRYNNRGIDEIDGVLANAIESSYNDPVLKRRSAYDKRKTYLARDDMRFLKSVFFDRSGEPVKTFRAGMHHNIGTEQEPRIRARRLDVTDHQTGQMSGMHLRNAVYDRALPKEFFTPEALPSWNEKQAPQALALTRGD